MTYNYEDFWKLEGKKPVGRKEQRFKDHALILPFYLDDLEFKSVLEIGPGDGRITELILDNYVINEYDAIDISEDRLNMLRKNCPSVQAKKCNIIDETITKKYDLVISVECLLHIKPEHIEQVIKKMVDSSNKYIVNIDFFPKEPIKMAFYNFIHDYESIYKKLGLKLRKRRINDEVLYIAEKSS